MNSDPLISQASGADRQGQLGAPFREYTLPTFSGVVVQALDKVRSPNANAADVAAAVEADPGVSVKLLGLANSACYGLTSPVNSAAHAVALLGRDQVETILLTVGVAAALPQSLVPELDASRFWCGAARRAAVARALAALIDKTNTHETFTAALLQDMALPLMVELKPDAYPRILATWRDENRDLAELERAEFGWDHAMVGAWMCQEWRFSSQVMRAIGAHHGVWEETDLPAVTLVSCLTDGGDDYGQNQLTEAVCERYSIPEDDVTSLLAECEQQAADLARLFA